MKTRKIKLSGGVTFIDRTYDDETKESAVVVKKEVVSVPLTKPAQRVNVKDYRVVKLGNRQFAVEIFSIRWDRIQKTFKTRTDAMNWLSERYTLD